MSSGTEMEWVGGWTGEGSAPLDGNEESEQEAIWEARQRKD